MTAHGYELGNGMVMSLARITGIEDVADQFVRLRIEAPLIARMRPRGLAPVFKLFTARHTGAPLTLPTFDNNRLAVPGWERDPARPIARAYTALDFTPGSEHITFDALDLAGSDTWIRRVREGDEVGVIGFKHELTITPEIDTLILVGDRSAQPAIADISRHATHDLQIQVVDLPDPSGTHPHPANTLHTLAIDVARTMLWIAGEVRQVAGFRNTALSQGVPMSRIVSLPYWHKGFSREEYDHILYRRYQEAADSGASLTDPATIARLELTPCD